jgi:hypothetical protein
MIDWLITETSTPLPSHPKNNFSFVGKHHKVRHSTVLIKNLKNIKNSFRSESKYRLSKEGTKLCGTQ